MRFYIALTSAAPDTRAPLSAHVLKAARRLAETVLPVPAASLRHDTWIAPSGSVALLAWTNEPVHHWLPEPLTSIATAGGTGVLGYTGYLDDPADIDRICTAPELGATVDRTGGAFGVFRALENGIDAVTPITRTDPVFYCQSAGLHVVGNRAVLTHLVARAAEEGPAGRFPPPPAYDIAPMQALVRHGFYISDETPFAGLTALPELSTLRIRDGRARVLRRDLPEPPAETPPPLRRRPHIRRLADALLASVEPVRKHNESISLSLTGGRDSRLVAATLYAAGIPFHASTRGFADHPDVVLAREICTKLGVTEHRVETPEQYDDESILVEHPLPRTTRLLRMTEGMNSAFENVIAPKSFALEARLSGSGGEALRGGWLIDRRDLTTDALRSKLRTIALAQSWLMTPEANAIAERLHEEYHQMCEPDFRLGLDRMFLKFRSGRWLPASRQATLVGYCMYHPFLDHRVRWEAMSLPPAWRWSEAVMYHLIAHLAPPLKWLPIADRPWRFDHRRVYNPVHRLARRFRPRLRARTGLGGFDWRRTLGPDYVAPMRDRILATPELFQLVDRQRTEQLLAEDPPKRAGQVWNLYTLAVLLSNEWLAPDAGTAESPGRIRVPIR
ncbi:hypothetical protein F4561_000990 [Lipingzhangella halophila]|uniref:Asparagine synthetase domain-containing protein n=1 Tax=Lipingzhangella halophila TaxID=1783352 RepID=A0A7W7RE57_9ACTN|nr:asparagine synthase-related protein [Lipingzhangella halophila]MBB4930170.1 hypothetical protein [Lipingzhangella halophila]